MGITLPRSDIKDCPYILPVLMGPALSGPGGIRTHNPLRAKQMLCRWSYQPKNPGHVRDKPPKTAGPPGQASDELRTRDWSLEGSRVRRLHHRRSRRSLAPSVRLCATLPSRWLLGVVSRRYWHSGPPPAGLAHVGSEHLSCKQEDAGSIPVTGLPGGTKSTDLFGRLWGASRHMDGWPSR